MFIKVISCWKQQPCSKDWRQFIQEAVRQIPEQFFGTSHKGSQCLLKQSQQNGQYFHESGLLKFFTSGVKQRSKRSEVFIPLPEELRHDIAAADHGGMSGQVIIGTSLTSVGKIEKRLGHFEEHFDIPPALIDPDDFLVT
jgi:hypothetical protein